jgi:hypothetical protein
VLNKGSCEVDDEDNKENEFKSSTLPAPSSVGIIDDVIELCLDRGDNCSEFAEVTASATMIIGVWPAAPTEGPGEVSFGGCGIATAEALEDAAPIVVLGGLGVWWCRKAAPVSFMSSNVTTVFEDGKVDGCCEVGIAPASAACSRRPNMLCGGPGEGELEADAVEETGADEEGVASLDIDP